MVTSRLGGLRRRPEWNQERPRLVLCAQRTAHVSGEDTEDRRRRSGSRLARIHHQGVERLAHPPHGHSATRGPKPRAAP